MDANTELERLKRELAAERLRREEAEQQRQREQQQTRSTTLSGYIEACHDLLFTKFAVETDKSFTSTGPTTNPKHKLCPKRLLPWGSFLEEQRTAFGTLYSIFPAETEEAFESRHFLQGLGARVSWKKIANERDLEHFQHNSVEYPVRSIVQRLALEETVKDEFDVGDGILFENHPYAVADVAEQVMSQLTTRPPPPPVTPDRSRQGPDSLYPGPGQFRPDQICVYRRDDGTSIRRKIAYIIEYKAPHKLTPPHLRLGLRPMDIYNEVVNRVTKPMADDPEALFQYHADRLAAAAVTQTFHYMIEAGLEHGFLTTGETIADPTTLYYHLAEPGQEVLAHPANYRYCTAVGQVLAFSLMALGQSGQREHGQEERRLAIDGLDTWTEDYEEMLRAMPATQRTPPPSSPGYRPTTYQTVDRSPYLLRNKTSRATRAGHSGTNLDRVRRSPSPSDDESGGMRMPETPTPTQARGGGRGSSSDGAGGRGRGRRFCTQKCLLGLVQGGLLDENCPNVSLHRGRGGSARHPVDHSEWLRLLREELKRTLDDGVVRMWKQGARGVMFQVTLLVHGYTFVSKATISAFVEDLVHEAEVYDRLQPLQGVCVPVFLGAVDLRGLGRIYYYDLRVRLVHMAFMSWAGDSLDEDQALESTAAQRLAQELVRSVRALHATGVAHTDVRKPNALWCRETRRVMLIDFERAVLVDPHRAPLAQVVPNKRARERQGLDSFISVHEVHSKAKCQRQLSNDILVAKAIFT
ncbi:hypothetical protein QBC46DRAFT_412796 [Diplogelasinospora grovesii]|uniref:Protein kinase domain-containing protein n=1 Tax=Diplogelasinospora grovesii TaxID=303347 RepID=A0AAN6N1D1_9PEZI|nr:hypothetical protein QBC46DRAFT_412796 [Diplogelasinospora grovesii]